MNVLGIGLNSLVNEGISMTDSDLPSTIYQSGIRADEYSAEVAPTVIRFQRAIERMTNCDYEALRTALHWARHTSLPITLSSLCTAYCIACRPTFRQQGAQELQ